MRQTPLGGRINKKTPTTNLQPLISSVSPPLSTRACRSPSLGSCSNPLPLGKSHDAPQVGHARVTFPAYAFASRSRNAGVSSSRRRSSWRLCFGVYSTLYLSFFVFRTGQASRNGQFTQSSGFISIVVLSAFAP